MSQSYITVMLLGGGKRVSLAQLLKKSGKDLGYEVRILSYDLSEEVPIALEGKVIKGLRWSDPAVVEDIEKTTVNYGVNIILPMVNGSIEIAAKCREKLKDIFIPVSSHSDIFSLFDKVEAAKVFKEAKFPIPKTYSVLSATMPAIAKPRHGGSSKGIKIFNDIEDLMHLHNLGDYIVQEYIEYRKEFTVDAYVNMEGEILVIVPRERLEVMGGESVRTITCRNEMLESFSRRVIERFKLRGPVNLQFIHDLDNDRYLLMEVNPRLGSGVIGSILAGAPITDYIIGEALGEKLIPCDSWKDRTLLARYLKEAVFYDDK